MAMRQSPCSKICSPRNERMFLVTVLVMNTAKSKSKLVNDIFQVSGVAQKYNCQIRPLGLSAGTGTCFLASAGTQSDRNSAGTHHSSTAIFVPFTTQELFQHGEALYYGLNALSNNLIMADRKLLKNPNGLILGTPGSGSLSAQRGKSLTLSC